MGRRRQVKRSRSRPLERLEPRCFLAADVRITEFVAANESTLLDEDGDSSDWVEVFNAGPDDVDLDGWFLTDDEDELEKWAFPEQVLPAGNFLVVFASDKDRARSGEQLHTDFRLSAGGEYLALSRQVGPAIEIVSEFAPEYPGQLDDIAYGVSQNVEETTLFTSDAAAAIWVGTEPPPPNWHAPEFNDESWLSGTAALGYQNTVPGFTIQAARSTDRIVNLSEADALLTGTGLASQTVATLPIINFLDAEGGGENGNFGDDLPFPNDTPANDNDFAVRATGLVTIPETGLWTFGTNSDDGVRLVVADQLVIDDDELHEPTDRFGTVELSAGQHPLELTYFERAGGAELELFARSGRRTRFSSRFELVGDDENGGLPIETSPVGATIGLRSAIQTDLFDRMYDVSANAFLRVPFEVSAPDELNSLTLRIQYDDAFVAYLNGTEIARRNAPTQLGIDATAITDRPLHESIQSRNISVSDYLDLIVPGENILAIHGLNASADSESFLIAAELTDITYVHGEAGYFREPTPGDFNATDSVEEFLVNDVSFDQPHGFREEAFDVTLTSATAGTQIRYTLDGTIPTETNGQDYLRPLRISQTTTLRARSFKDGADPSRVATATYLFLDDVVKQSPSGLPPEGFPRSRSINGQQLDYGMDPAIVESTRWGRHLEDALKQVPSLSIVMDIDDLLGSRRGIYTHARSHGRAWERPVSLEMIHPDGETGFQIDAGLRIRGGFSRSGGNPKHAFRLFFRDEYGAGKLRYPLFGEEGTDSFDKVDLRTTQNYSWAFGGDARNTFLRDIFSRDVQGAMGQPYTRGRYHHLYINGQYWGLFQTEERPEARYAESYFGGNSDDYDVVKSAGSSGAYQNEATDGTLDAYRRLADFFYQEGGLSDENIEDYYRAQGMNRDGSRNPAYERLLDVDNIIDYMIITYYTSDADGPGSKFTRPRVNNYFGIFNRANPDGFKFFEHDSEHSLDTGNAAGANYNMVTPLTTGGSQFRYFNPHWMHEQLANTNSEYRLRFADAVYRHLFHDGVLTAENALEIIDQRASQFDQAMIAESARWGDARRGSPLTQSHWRSAVNATRNFIENRREDFLAQLRSQDWFPEEAPPQFAVDGEPQHGGTANGLVDLMSDHALSFSTVVVPAGSEWSYLDDGTDQRTAWRSPDFDDSGWKTGQAQLGYGDGDETTVVEFGENSRAKHRTTYFRTSFEVDSLEGVEAAMLRLLRDDGAVVYLNGEEVARSNMPSGSIRFNTLALRNVLRRDENKFFNFPIDASLLREGTNHLAVEIHKERESNSDLSFDLELALGRFDPSQAAVFYTLDGSDPRLPDGEISANAIAYDRNGLSVRGATLIRARSWNEGTWSVINQAEFTPGVLPGDVTNDGILNASDIDALAAALRDRRQEDRFDLDGNETVDQEDKDYLVETVMSTQYGDINLDGIVAFADFVILSTNYGQNVDSWAEGDLNGDLTVDFNDFLLVSGNFLKAP